MASPTRRALPLPYVHRAIDPKSDPSLRENREAYYISAHFRSAPRETRRSGVWTLRQWLGGVPFSSGIKFKITNVERTRGALFRITPCDLVETVCIISLRQTINCRIDDQRLLQCHGLAIESPQDLMSNSARLAVQLAASVPDTGVFLGVDSAR